MKTLFLTSQQAAQLGCDLKEYVDMKDSSDREIFKGFKISFGDMLSKEMQPDQSFEMTPIPEFTEISKDT